MGTRGPAPKPAALRALDGNPGKRRVNKVAPVANGEPVCPEHLSGYARDVWVRIVGSMPPQLYGIADTEILAAYCVSAALHRSAVIAVAAEGEVLEGEDGSRQNPWISILTRHAALIATLGTRLGLDPAARNNLTIKPTAQVGKFAGLVGIQGGRTA